MSSVPEPGAGAPTARPSESVVADPPGPSISSTPSPTKSAHAQSPALQPGAVALAILAMGFTFCLAWTPIRESDVWHHLARGRALAKGWPLPETLAAHALETSDAYHYRSWLFDVALWAGHAMLGDLLAWLKPAGWAAWALLVWLAIPRVGRGALAPLLLALTAFAMTPHLALRPMLPTLMLLGFLVGWLERGARAFGGSTERSPESASEKRSPSVWIAVIAGTLMLWANVGDHVWVGLAAVVLSSFRKALRPVRILMWLTLPAVLLQPATVTFAWQEILHWTPRRLHSPAQASVYYDLLHRAWSNWPITHFAALTSVTLSVLLLLTERFTIGLCALGLAAAVNVWDADLAPVFIALTACLALTRLGVLLQKGDDETPSGTFVPACVGLMLLLGIVSAWPGWLQGTWQRRTIGLEQDAALVQVAGEIDGTSTSPSEPMLDHDKKVRTPVWLTTSRSAGQRLTWLAPRAAIIFEDTLRGLEGDRSPLVKATREALTTGPNGNLDAGAYIRVLDDWIDSHGVSSLVVHHDHDRSLAALLGAVFRVPARWTPKSFHGRLVAFVPNEKKSSTPPAWFVQRLSFDVNSETTPMKVHPALFANADVAWWRRQANGPDNLRTDEAIVELIWFDSQRELWIDQSYDELDRSLIVHALGAMSSGNPNAAWLAIEFPLSVLANKYANRLGSNLSALDAVTTQLIVGHLRSKEDGPIVPVFHAVQQSRRVLADRPADATAHARLAQAYRRLMLHGKERSVRGAFPWLDRLRPMQLIVNLHRSLELEGDNIAAHRSLAEAYEQIGYLDLALRHWHAVVQRAEADGRRPDEPLDDWHARLQVAANREKVLGKIVRERMNLVETQGFHLSPYRFAQLADQNGLAGVALDKLLRSPYAQIGVEGAEMQYTLMLWNGQLRDVLAWMEPGQEKSLGAKKYRGIRLLALATMGDYAGAQKTLDELVEMGTVSEPIEPGFRPRGSALLQVSQHLLDVARNLPVSYLDGTAMLRSMRIQRLAAFNQEEVEWHVLRGMLFLETGETSKARDAFRRAVDDSVLSASGPLTVARHYLEILR